MLKLLFRLVFVLLIVALLGGVTVAFLAVSSDPLVAGGADISPATIERAVALLEEHDPRGAPDGQLRTVVLTQGDVNALASYAAGRFRGAAEVTLLDREAFVRATVPVPDMLIGSYLNVSAVLGETLGLPRISSLTVGSVPVPRWIANYALERAVQRFGFGDQQQAAEDALSSLSFAEGLVRVEYEWSGDLPDRLRQVAVSDEEIERLREYHERVVRSAEELDPRQASFARLVEDVMRHAQERSAGGPADAENRAAIVAVTLYTLGRGPSALIPEAKTWSRALPRRLVLRGRDDLPKHFSLSAALAATAGTPLSDAIGLYKELEDARGGSGFSFSDIVADRAGTVFGEAATRSPGSAGELQTRIGTGLAEDDFMPDVGGLADNMPQEEFVRRFGGVGAPAYNSVVADIEQRVAQCRLFR
ncbi:MAG: hypothetical protein FJW23_07090 [Acidimicrobiia bacterium]|nr:hypothetical protein [Acidimicrobiia bacterium]